MIKQLCASVLGVSLLTGCVVSEDPNVNAAATAAVTSVATNLVLYSLQDHRYYTEDYQVLPVHYRPAPNVTVRKVYYQPRVVHTHPRVVHRTVHHPRVVHRPAHPARPAPRVVHRPVPRTVHRH